MPSRNQADLVGPIVHHRRNLLTTGLTNPIPQILGPRIAIKVVLEVHGHALKEGLLPDHVAQHFEDAGALGVGDGVKDLLDRVLVGAGHFDGVRGAERVEREGAAEVLADEGGVDLPRGFDL